MNWKLFKPGSCYWKLEKLFVCGKHKKKFWIITLIVSIGRHRVTMSDNLQERPKALLKPCRNLVWGTDWTLCFTFYSKMCKSASVKRCFKSLQWSWMTGKVMEIHCLNGTAIFNCSQIFVQDIVAWFWCLCLNQISERICNAKNSKIC